MQMTYRARNIAIAVGLALLAALLTTFYVTNYKRHVQQGEHHVTVLVAKQDIPVGTAGEDTSSMVGTEHVPRRSVVPGSVAEIGQLRGLLAAQPTFAGEQITTRRFTTAAESGVRGQLKGTMRAFQIQGDQDQLLAGVVEDGDRVDVVAALQVRSGGSDRVFSRVIVRDIKVLRAPGAPPPGNKLTGPADSRFAALLGVSDNQAQKLQLMLSATSDASGGAGWHLQLRPLAKANDSPDHVDSVQTVLADGLHGQQRRALSR